MYKKNFSQGGGSRFGGGSGGRGGNGYQKEMVMHKATCSKCGKTCEVPFRPTGEKPVYCRDCFQEMGGGAPRGESNRPPRRDFDNRFEPRNDAPRSEPRFERKPEARSEAPRGPSNDDLKRQLEMVNTKLDKLVYLAEKLLAPAQAPTKEAKTAGATGETKQVIKKAKKKGPIKR